MRVENQIVSLEYDGEMCVVFVEEFDEETHTYVFDGVYSTITGEDFSFEIEEKYSEQEIVAMMKKAIMKSSVDDMFSNISF